MPDSLVLPLLKKAGTIAAGLDDIPAEFLDADDYQQIGYLKAYLTALKPILANVENALVRGQVGAGKMPFDAFIQNTAGQLSKIEFELKMSSIGKRKALAK